MSKNVNNDVSMTPLTQWHVLSGNITEERFNSTRSTKGRYFYFTETISDIGEFSHLIDCHGVCGNNNGVFL